MPYRPRKVLMSTAIFTPDQIVQRGEAIYNDRIRQLVEPDHIGEVVVINVETGEYEMDADDVAASERASDRFGSAALYAMRVGEPGLYRFGGLFPDSDR